MKLKFFSRKSKGSDKSVPINGDRALGGLAIEGQPKKNGSNSDSLVNLDSAHNGSVAVHRKANNLKKVPVNRSAHNGAVPAPRKMLFGRKKNDSKSTSAVSQGAGLLALPNDVHFTSLGDLLNPGDWARLAATCKGLNGIYTKKIISYRDKLIKQFFPPAVLDDELFKMYPIDYSRLLKVLKKSGLVIKMMASNGIKPPHIAALLGMWNALESSYTHCDLYIAKDREGYSPSHYRVVWGDKTDVENHLNGSSTLFVHRRDDILALAEIAAGAGSVDVLEMLNETFALNFKVINNSSGRLGEETSLIHPAVQFDQYETVKWLIEKGAETYKGRNLLCFAAEHGRLKIFNYFLGIDLNTNRVNDFRDDYKDIDEYNISVSSRVHAACGDGNLKLLKKLSVSLGEGCLKTTDIYNRTALHYGVMSDNMELIEWLVEEHHLSLSAEDAFGKTPLHVLAEAAQERPQLWQKLPLIAEKYGIETVTEFRDENGLSFKDYLESAGQEDILNSVNTMCRGHHGLQ